MPQRTCDETADVGVLLKFGRDERPSKQRIHEPSSWCEPMRRTRQPVPTLGSVAISVLFLALRRHGVSSADPCLQYEDQVESSAVGYPTTSGRGSGGETDHPSPKFAVIGDFGTGNSASWEVAKMVHSWDPEYVVTTGDNWYHSPDWSTLHNRLCSPWHEWMVEEQCSGYSHRTGTQPLFIPAMGNHDWYSPEPYFHTFQSLPRNGRYYDVRKSPIHFFVLNSDESEYDGTWVGSKQHSWFVDAVASSDEPYKIVVFHHPALCTVRERINYNMQWPFHELGITAVLNGHMHGYERLLKNGTYYMVNGAGGCCPKGFDGYDVDVRSQVIHGYEKAGYYVHGAQKVLIHSKLIELQFWSINECLVDSVSIPLFHHGLLGEGTPLVSADSKVRYLDCMAPVSWTSVDFDDELWNLSVNNLLGEHGRKVRIAFGPSMKRFSYLKLRVRRIHGLSVWINNKPVWQLNVAQGDLQAHPYACTDHVSNWVETWLDGDILSANGTNVLSVQVHNRYDGAYGTLEIELEGYAH